MESCLWKSETEIEKVTRRGGEVRYARLLADLTRLLEISKDFAQTKLTKRLSTMNASVRSATLRMARKIFPVRIVERPGTTCHGLPLHTKRGSPQPFDATHIKQDVL